VIKGYDFEPLFEKLSEIWACVRVRENERIRKMLEKEHGTAVNLYSIFENEFGRPLSPMEVEQINLWSTKLSSNMVLEALRKAVMMGKHNFKYIDHGFNMFKKGKMPLLPSRVKNRQTLKQIFKQSYSS